nr:MAG TPA: Cytosine specific methyltransferase [Caudoviricetes sp.]
MQHLGDITQIRGDNVPVVDCIIGGSPCQDLSIAGKRAGLAGGRSGLFMEQIRITKEMREHDRSTGRANDLLRPRYMVWENVPGAFNSNKGEDFASVLTEIVWIAEPDAPRVPVPRTGWPKWGSLRDVGGRWSVAWRTLDAQYWGVPQRRRRIALVADFGGSSAAEVLFVRTGVRGDSTPRGTAGQGAAGTAESGAYGAGGVRALTPWDAQSRRLYSAAGVMPSLQSRSSSGQNQEAVLCIQGNCIDRADTARCNGKGWREDVSYTLNTIDRPAVFDMSHACDVIRECGEVVPSLQARAGTGENQVSLTYQMQGFGDYREGDVASSCKQRDFKSGTDLVCAVDCRNGTENPEINGTLQSASGQSLNLNNVVREHMTVRRLTPLEYERLQGFPDGWTDIGAWTDSKGKLHKESSDSARYKALGNSIALPPWKWVLKRLCAQYERDATMASLFDGIGGFPLIWEQINGAGSCLWASEIEEFPIAVTKKRFERRNL